MDLRKWLALFAKKFESYYVTCQLGNVSSCYAGVTGKNRGESIPHFDVNKTGR
jgi:hypothetical protein